MKGTEIAKARDAWLETEDGQECLDGSAEGQFLKNRIETAFMAGVAATERYHKLTEYA